LNSSKDSKGLQFHRLLPADFARLSSSLQLTLLAIRRAQPSSRMVIAQNARTKRRQTDLLLRARRFRLKSAQLLAASSAAIRP
jgi:hypothetical protein